MTKKRKPLYFLTPENQPLGPELKAMFESGCRFDDTHSSHGMLLFCSQQGMLWDKTWNDLNEGQRRKLNVARTSYYEWLEK